MIEAINISNRIEFIELINRINRVWNGFFGGLFDGFVVNYTIKDEMNTKTNNEINTTIHALDICGLKSSFNNIITFNFAILWFLLLERHINFSINFSVSISILFSVICITLLHIHGIYVFKFQLSLNILFYSWILITLLILNKNTHEMCVHVHYVWKSL